MMINKCILRDGTDRQYDDLITFKENVLIDDVYNAIASVKENVEDYTNEDIYVALRQLAPITIEWIGNYNVIQY